MVNSEFNVALIGRQSSGVGSEAPQVERRDSPREGESRWPSIQESLRQDQPVQFVTFEFVQYFPLLG